jgi:hypothetical protein
VLALLRGSTPSTRRTRNAGPSARANGSAIRTLPAEVVDSLRRQLSEQRKVKRAYIARRVLEHLDDEYPSYVLGVQFGFLKLDDSSSIVGRLAQELEVPAEFFVVDLDRARPMRRRMRKLSGSEIYRR